MPVVLLNFVIIIINLTLLKINQVNLTLNKSVCSLLLHSKATIDFSGKALSDLKYSMRHFAALSSLKMNALNDSFRMYESTKSPPNLMNIYIFLEQIELW